MGVDSIFGAPTKVAAISPAVAYDDGGEPDFAGWLSAQTQAKSKTSLPKGLSKIGGVGKVPTGAAKGSTGAGRKGLPVRPAAQKAVTAPKVINTRPKETEEDDGWGDAWD